MLVGVTEDDLNSYPIHNNLKENISLKKKDALRFGENLGADYVIYGEISPIRDILITLKILP